MKRKRMIVGGNDILGMLGISDLRSFRHSTCDNMVDVEQSAAPSLCLAVDGTKLHFGRVR